MALTETVRVRIDAELKHNVEQILSQLGMTTSQAINLFMKKIERERGIPFELKLPNDEILKAIEEAEAGINMEEITLEQMVAEHKTVNTVHNVKSSALC